MLSRPPFLHFSYTPGALSFVPPPKNANENEYTLITSTHSLLHSRTTTNPTQPSKITTTTEKNKKKREKKIAIIYILIFFPITLQTPENCSTGSDCMPMIISWEGTAEIQSGDVLIVEVDDTLLLPADMNFTNNPK